MQQTIKLSQFHPQDNLPKNGTTNNDELKLFNRFVKLLKIDLQSKMLERYAIGSELNLNGYGIADLALLEFYTIRKDPKRLFTKRIITVYEIKIKDWRKALKQAYRYKYYSHKSIVVMPEEKVARAIKNIEIFRALEVGLWIYSREKNSINKVYTPRIKRPFSKLAFRKAVLLLANRIKSPQSF